MPSSVVEWSGEVDYARVARLQAELHRVVDEAAGGAADGAVGDRSVVVDLGAVTFFDCAGIATLATAHARASARGVDLRLRAVPPRVTTLLRLTGVDTLFTGS